MKKFILFISLLAFVCCKTEQDAEKSAEEAVDTTAFQAKIKIEDNELALRPEARDYALGWVEFITAQNEIEKLNNSTVNEVMSNAGAIAQIMESLKTSVPDSLRSVPVEARLNVVNTKAQLLRQYSAKQEPDAEVIAQTTKELFQEFNNLKLQMNEIFLKSLEDFEKELDEFEQQERQKDTTSEDF
ncbi:hypothetical protein NE848_08615 [Gramella jeungdoensis]|uniref:Lipoprotein n=1 Tax=Gramella jeungdoensis TaxID=708091 RepID=A0ABT0Z1K9_9FLAO|nr:hypothetical protein [Gramella jeungdoensis]MCM8569439.1 hypothetical protein [Gramella jeungdoensis]